MKAMAEGSMVVAVLASAVGLVLHVGGMRDAGEAVADQGAQVVEAAPLVDEEISESQVVDAVYPLYLSTEGSCSDPGWTDEDMQECLESWSEVQCRILEGAHLDAQNGATYYFENHWLPTNYFEGVKQQKKLCKWGDIPPDIGVCTDTVIRALRNADIDLQWLVFKDMKAEEGKPKKQQSYPWGSFKKKKADPSIDHRRCPNLRTFFTLHAQSLPIETDQEHLDTWQPGDIVYWDLKTGRYHIGVVSDQKGPSGLPRVFHNFPSPGYSCEEDALTSFEIIGHFRYPAPGEEVPVVPKPSWVE